MDLFWCRSARAAVATSTIIASIIVAAGVGAGIFSVREQLTGTGSGGYVQVVKRHVTVHGEPAFIGNCSAIAASCGIPATDEMSLDVELIEYRGSYYYVYSNTLVNGGIVTGTFTNSTGQTVVTTITYSQSTVMYTAWFNNSTLYCVSPFMHTAPITCPP